MQMLNPPDSIHKRHDDRYAFNLSAAILCSTITTDHLAQLVLLGKFSAQNLKISNQRLAAVDQGLPGGQLAVGLDAKLELGEEGVRNWILGQQGSQILRAGLHTLVASEDDMRVLEEMGTDHVGESVIFLVESEDRTVRSACNN